MKKASILLLAVVAVVGCGSGSADEALKDAAPPVAGDAQPGGQNLNKNMPTQGGPSGMDSQPMVAPGK